MLAVNIARIVPDGLLVFFPSYTLLQSCVDFWKAPVLAGGLTVWERIEKHKCIVCEQREGATFQATAKEYAALLNDGKGGAAFFAVCRGKVSEGLDFADRLGRAVVVTGIPYALKTDAKVRLKREYLDERSRSNGTLAVAP
eukprot:SM004120S15591  [mRNA]  locus=s4120:215:1213:+ [translate_table: standard]